jgi:hypothetical protein
LRALLAEVGRADRIEDHWCQQIAVYLGGNPLPDDFVGHCCEWKTSNAEKKIANLATRLLSQQPSRYDGCLYLPEYNLLIDSPLGGAVDNHGLGSMTEEDGFTKIGGAWHAVVPTHLAVQCEASAVLAGGSGLKLSHDPIRSITVPALHAKGKEMQVCLLTLPKNCVFSFRGFTNYFAFQFNIEVIRVEKSTTFDSSQKGQHMSLEDIQRAGLYSGNTRSDCDGTILEGMTSSGTRTHLLLMRWHASKEISSLTKGQQMMLYEDIQKLLPRCGFEAIRKGGSSGETKVSKEFLKFLRAPGNLPRKAYGMKFIRKKLHWAILYISTGKPDRKAVNYEGYAQPQSGGSFDVPRKLFEKYPALQAFVACKYYAALVIDQLNHASITNIQPAAIRHELQELEEAAQYATESLDIIAFLGGRNKHTMVCHPVGYHLDVFNDKLPSLENRVCFVHPRLAPACGRGGAGPGVFVWALLDWRNSSTGQRRRDYLSQGGNPKQKVTDEFWNKWSAAQNTNS